MKRVVVLALVTTMMVPALPITAAGRFPAQAGQATGGLQGTATSASGQALPNYTVQLRNLGTGQLTGTTTSSAAGSFTFTGLTPGNYVVEVVNSTGTIVGSSAAVAVAAGQTVTVGVSASAAAAAAGGGAAMSSGVSTAVIVTTVAAAAGIAGAVAFAVNNDDSGTTPVGQTLSASR
jgi:hypothetical protein